MIDQALKDMLDKRRPDRFRTWPDNGLRFHLGMLKDGSWRAVVCATEAEAEKAFGADLQAIHVAKEFMDQGEELAWGNPGIVFEQSPESTRVWVTGEVNQTKAAK